MASNSFGDLFRVTTFGESHGAAVGAVVDGVPAGLRVDMAAIQREMDRRRPGQSKMATRRSEPDTVELLSGVFEGITTGAPVAIMVKNVDQRSSDYNSIKDLFRPGHADITWFEKYGHRDWRGGGRSSGRETAARVAAGALAKQIIATVGMKVIAHVVRVESVIAETFDETEIGRNEIRCADASAAVRMMEAVKRAKADGDTVGGVVEIVATGVPAGLGDPVFDKLDARLAAALMSIGAVKGVEIGDGFALTSMRGSRSNDPIRGAGTGSNRMGGMLGGISNGAPVVARMAVKPTPSIAILQHTLDIDGNEREIKVPGRHDPCICPRVVPVAEAMTALVLCDLWLKQRAARLSTDKDDGRLSRFLKGADL
ncbi:MAG: chorismate synthase [Myxococcota bacterium]|jgi:chorismate synthase